MKKPISPKAKAESEKRTKKTEKRGKNGWRDETDPYEKYKKYVKGKEWRETCGWLYSNVYAKKCYFCGRTESDGAVIQMHHNSYAHLFNEAGHPEDVVPVCSSCHRHLHRLRTNWCRFSMKKNQQA